jgi:hypothetical protein
MSTRATQVAELVAIDVHAVVHSSVHDRPGERMQAGDVRIRLR